MKKAINECKSELFARYTRVYLDLTMNLQTIATWLKVSMNRK